MAEVPAGLDAETAVKFVLAQNPDKEAAAKAVAALIAERGLDPNDPDAKWMRDLAQDYGVTV